MGQLLPEWHLPQMAHVAFHLWHLAEMDLLTSFHTTECQHYYTLEMPLPLGVFGLNTFNHPWKFQVSYMFPPPSLVPLVPSHISVRTCQRLTQTFDSGGTMLDGGSLASHSSQHVDRHSSALSHHGRFHRECFSRPHAQGSAISAFSPLVAQMCVTQVGVLFLSLSGSGGGKLSIYDEGLPTMLEGMGRLVCSRGYAKQFHICP